MKNAIVFEYVTVVAAVDDRNPCFELELYVAVDGERSHEGDSVPTAGPNTILPVRFMLDEEGDLPDETVVIDDRVCQSYAGIVVEVIHGKRFLEYIPKGFLRISDEQVGVERQFAFGEPLADTQLELHVGVLSGRFAPDGGTPDEIVVFEERKVRPFIQFGAHAVGVIFGDVAAYLGVGCDSQEENREKNRETFHRRLVFANIVKVESRKTSSSGLFAKTFPDILQI